MDKYQETNPLYLYTGIFIDVMSDYLDFYSHLLLEGIGHHTSLYHRSPIRLKVGDHIKVPKEKTGKHWLETKEAEIALEVLRREEYADRPSRFDCIYSTLIPRARFVDKGYLYRVRPVGKIHVTDSLYIDRIIDRFEREYYDSIRDRDDRREYYKEHPKELVYFLPVEANYYWDGVEPSRVNLKDVEVLSEGAVVIEEITETEKSQPFRIGDTVVVTESNKLRATLDLYINTIFNRDKAPVTDDEKKKLFDYIKDGLFDHATFKEEFGSFRFSGALKKGAKLKLTSFRHTLAYGRTEPNKGKFNTIMADFYLPDGSLVTRVITDKNISHRFTIALYQYMDPGVEKVYDFSKYLKKVSS